MEPVAYYILIMIFAGLFGGVVNFFISEESESYPPAKHWFYRFIKAMFTSVAGAFLVPLFLKIISFASANPGGELSTEPRHLLVFSGFCLIGSIFARNFMTTISDRVLKMAKEAKKESAEAKEKVKEVKKEADATQAKVIEIKNEIKQDIEEVKDEVARTDIGESAKTSEISRLNFAPPSVESDRGTKVPGDQQKNQWGGKPVRNEREISAKVYEDDDNDGYYKIALSVKSLNPSNPLTGSVAFHLHESFAKDIRIKKVKNGIASLTVYAYGAFTVGAVCDEGRTQLELDLAKLDDAPKEFREN